MKHKGIFLTLLSVLLIASLFVGCNQADKVSSNLAKEADNFNCVRQLTVINCIENEIMLQMTGKMSINADRGDNQLEVVVEDEKNGHQYYKKCIVGLSDNVSYFTEDLYSQDVSNYKFTMNFNPKMTIPVEVDTID